MTIASTLAAAADLIAKPEGWTQCAIARDYKHDAVDWNSSFATCFCLVGAIAKADGRHGSLALKYAVQHGHAGIWNDAPNRTQAQVVAKLRELSALAAEQGV